MLHTVSVYQWKKQNNTQHWIKSQISSQQSKHKRAAQMNKQSRTKQLSNQLSSSSQAGSEWANFSKKRSTQETMDHAMGQWNTGGEGTHRRRGQRRLSNQVWVRDGHAEAQPRARLLRGRERRLEVAGQRRGRGRRRGWRVRGLREREKKQGQNAREKIVRIKKILKVIDIFQRRKRSEQALFCWRADIRG